MIFENLEFLNVLKIDKLEIEPGKIYGIIGSNGSGKSTLLNQLAFRIISEDIGDIGYATSSNSLFNQSIYKNLSYPLTKAKVTQKEEIEFELKKYELFSIRKRNCKKLSSGESQKVMFLKILLNKPKFMLFDEITGNLDPKTVQLIENDLFNLVNEESYILFVSHNMNQIMRVANKIIYIENGRVDRIIDKKEIYEYSKVRIFMEYGA
jgi:tungstate transport system ATP-binding protein